MATIIRTSGSDIPCDPLWEAAYLRFESPQQEIAKFKQRLLRLGADSWPRDAQIAELFCGRGGAIHAWQQLGFQHVVGVDLSERLLSCFDGSATLYAADARELPFADGSKSIVAVQGGLHHLPSIPEDLDRTLSEVRRVLAPTGHFVVVEPWLTPFLRLVHTISSLPPVRRRMPKLDAFAEMVEREASTYFAWLSRPQAILDCFARHFDLAVCRRRFGKIEILARPKPITRA